MASMRKNIMKVPLSTALFWFGCFITLLGAGLQFQLFPFLLVVAGLVIAVSLKYRGDYEQDQLLKNERKAREAAEQRVWNDTPSGRQHGALSQHASMHKDSHQ